jgi:hypothetical protein
VSNWRFDGSVELHCQKFFSEVEDENCFYFEGGGAKWYENVVFAERWTLVDILLVLSFFIFHIMINNNVVLRVCH